MKKKVFVLIICFSLFTLDYAFTSSYQPSPSLSLFDSGIFNVSLNAFKLKNATKSDALKQDDIYGGDSSLYVTEDETIFNLGGMLSFNTKKNNIIWSGTITPWLCNTASDDDSDTRIGIDFNIFGYFPSLNPNTANQVDIGFGANCTLTSMEGNETDSRFIFNGGGQLDMDIYSSKNLLISLATGPYSRYLPLEDGEIIFNDWLSGLSVSTRFREDIYATFYFGYSACISHALKVVDPPYGEDDYIFYAEWGDETGWDLGARAYMELNESISLTGGILIIRPMYLNDESVDKTFGLNAGVRYYM